MNPNASPISQSPAAADQQPQQQLFAAQQQQQQHPGQSSYQMTAPLNTAPAPQAAMHHQAPAMSYQTPQQQPAQYGQYATYPQQQQTASMMSYHQPPAPPGPIHVPQVPVNMPQGYPPLMPNVSFHLPPWRCMGERLLAMEHPTDCATCDSYRAHYRAGSREPQFSQAHSSGQAMFQQQLINYMWGQGWTVRQPGEGGEADEKALQNARAEAARLRGERDDIRNKHQDSERKNTLLNRTVEQYKGMLDDAGRNKDRYRTERDEARNELERVRRDRDEARDELGRVRRERDEARRERDNLNRLHNEARDRGHQRGRSRSPPPPRGDSAYPQRRRTPPSGPSGLAARSYRPLQPPGPSGHRATSTPAQPRQQPMAAPAMQASSSMGTMGLSNVTIHLPTAPPPTPLPYEEVTPPMGEPPQTMNEVADLDDPMDGGERPVTHYPPGYVHPSNIAFDSADESEEEPPDGTGAAALMAKRRMRDGLKQAKREMKAKLNEPVIHGPGWNVYTNPTGGSDGMATWGEIPAYQPGPSTHRDHHDRRDERRQAPRSQPLPELRRHSTRSGSTITHYMPDEWPQGVIRPTSLPIHLGDYWSYYIPLGSSDAYGLMKEAREQGDGLLARVRDLIRQYDTYAALQSIKSLRTIKESWRYDDDGPTTRVERNPHRPVGSTGLRQPSHQDPPDIWNKYWAVKPDSIPDPLRPLVRDGFVNNDIIRGNGILKAMVPSVKKTKNIENKDDQYQLRSVMLDLVVRLFSIPGLFNALAERDGLQRAEKQDLKKIQGDHTTLAERDLVSWAMQCGITEESVVLAERVARIYRNYSLKREVNDESPGPTWPATIEDVIIPPAPMGQEAAGSTSHPNPLSLPRASSRASHHDVPMSPSRPASCPPVTAASRAASPTASPAAPTVDRKGKGRQRINAGEDTISLYDRDSSRDASPADDGTRNDEVVRT